MSMPPVITIIGALVIGIDIGQSRGLRYCCIVLRGLITFVSTFDGPHNWRPASSAAMGDMLLMPE